MRKIGKEGKKANKCKKWEKEWDIDTKRGRERERVKYVGRDGV